MPVGRVFESLGSRSAIVYVDRRLSQSLGSEYLQVIVSNEHILDLMSKYRRA
jgi:hypothetical protein